MKRRDFLLKSAAGVAGIGMFGLPLSAAAAGGEIKLTVLHTNDQHSHIDPLEGDRMNTGLGGMARRATLVNNIRQQEAYVLLLDAGDIWQGTPYFNYFHGELEYKLMSQMKYDAATLGNHDFDIGLEGLQRQLPHAQFPFLTANYDFSRTILKDKFQPYKVFEKGGLRIGIFGLGIELEGFVAKKAYAETVYLDPVNTAQQMVQQLREKEKCHLVICLSHLGYRYNDNKISDLKLAEQVSGIDLIIGGHTHTFMKKPDVVRHSSGHETMINQVGWAGTFLGRIDFSFQKKTKEKTGVRTAVLPVDHHISTS